MQPNIIGFCGAAGSGKDEAARVLCEEFGYTKRSFADTLRREIADLLRDRPTTGFPGYVLDAIGACLTLRETDPWLKPTPPAMRALLQRYGTDFRRTQDIDYWVNAELQTLPMCGRFVYTDVRFPNEVRLVRSLGGSMFRVDRPGYGPTPHASEQHFPFFEVDRVIANNGSKADLHMRVRSLMIPLGPEDYAAAVHARQAREATQL